MAITHTFRKSPFDLLRQRRDELFTSRASKPNSFLGTAAQAPSGLLHAALGAIQRDGRVLILGNGRAETLCELAPHNDRTMLADWSSSALAATEEARRKLGRREAERVKATLLTGHKMPWPDGTFDGILVSGIACELEHTTTLWKECSRLLANDGQLVVAVPNSLAGYHSEFTRLYDAKSLAAELSLWFEQAEVETKNGTLVARCSNRLTTRHPLVTTMMNIRNEDRWLREVLDSAARVSDAIVVYDDGSTDKTQEICQTHCAVTSYQRGEENDTDKARDKNRMYALAQEFSADWVLCIDGDEVLEPSAPRRMLEAMRNAGRDVTQIDFEFLYLWNDREHYRTDGIYTGIFHPCLFRPGAQTWSELKFEATAHGGNLHCERVPQNLKGERIRADIKIEHLGYMYAEDRLRKYFWNKGKDPKHAQEGYYEHLLDQPHMTLALWDGRPDSQTTKRNASQKQTLKPDYYYANARRNIAERVPRNAKSVLDVGCGNGATGKLIKELTGARVTGIEIHPEVAQVAREVLDEVHSLDVEAQDLPNGAMFDCIVFGDVLEHLIDPWSTLRKLATHLSPNGCMIASLPNVRNLGVIGKLLEGSWNYAEYGILDSTHLRFFAKGDMVKLFAQAGLRADVVEVVRDPLFEQKMPPTDARTLDMGDLVLRNLKPTDIEELTAQQFIFMAVPDATVLPKPQPVVSVVIPVFNNLRYTKSCLESLYHTNETTPFEIIVVDDGSTDGTAEYLAEQAERIRVVTHERNCGFARSCNDGARASLGQMVVFLNNDTEVLPNWLDAMVEAMKADRRIGITGNLQIFPDTMRVQQAGIVCDENGQVHSIYNGVLPANHPVVQKAREFQFIAGSCLMIWRQLFMEVGGFDEAYQNSCEDIDLCMRVTQTGRKVWYCPQSRIYHHESRTVSGHDKNSANYRRLLSRWKDSMIADADKYYTQDGFQLLPDGRVIPLEQETTTVMMQPQSTPVTTSARIALLTTYQQRCGLAIYAEQLVSALKTSGEDVLVLAERTDEITAAPSREVIRCWSRDAQGGSEILPLLKAHGIQVLHINHGGMFALDGWLINVMKQARAENIRVVTTFHSTETRDERLAEIARHGEQCFVHHRQNIVELAALGAPADRIHCTPIPLPELQFADLAEAKLLLEWNPAQKIVATFGMIDPHKGVRELIEAMPDVLKTDDVKLLIVGAPHPDSQAGMQYLIDCIQLVKELKLEDRVRFLTDFIPEDELTVTLQACDVLVLNYQSSRFEGSACLTRALATGRPVVTSTAPALDIAAPVTLCTTEQFDLPQAIHRALTNPFLTRALRDNVLELAMRTNWLTTAAKYREAYDDVLQREAACTTDLLKFYATHPDEIYNEPLQRERVRWLASKATGRILEIGPANGYVVQFCNGHEAVDIYRERLDVARALRPGIAFNYGNVVSGLPYGDQSFDTVMSPEIFEHVEWEMAVVALKECMRVGKRVLITIPNADKPNYNPDLVHNPEHRWLVTRQLVNAWLAAAGATDYELDCSRDLDFYLLDINSQSKAQSARVTERAANLPHFEVTPGPQLTVAFDASSITDETLRTTESSRYFVELLNHLREVRPDWRLLLASDHANDLRMMLSNAGGAEAFEVITWNQLPRSGAQALYLPDPVMADSSDYFTLAKESGMVTACSFNDVIPLAYPQFYLTHDPLARDRYVRALRAVSQQCDLLFCTTQATVQELQIRLGMQLKNLRTVHGGATLTRTSPVSHYENPLLQNALNGDTSFFLCAGELSPVKNLRTILESAAAMPAHVKLVLAYSMNEQAAAQLREAAQRDGFRADSLVIPGPISEADEARLYARATALLTPSLMDGLSLSVVNAMALGTPIIAGDTTAQREVCGDATLFVDPLSSEDLRKAMQSLLTHHELRKTLKEATLTEAPRYNWQRTAEKVAVYLTEAVVKSGALQTTSVAAQASKLRA